MAATVSTPLLESGEQVAVVLEHVGALPATVESVDGSSVKVVLAVPDDRVKRLITFNELNLMAQWPFRGTFDVIFCRNVVIYFDEPTQTKIWSRFAGLLPENGHLYIGHSERVSGEAKHLFDNIGITTYRRIANSTGRKV